MAPSLRVAVLAACAVFAPLARAQTLVVDNTTVGTSFPAPSCWLAALPLSVPPTNCPAATDDTVAPAAVEVSAASSNASTDLFPVEAIQLTDSVLANLTDLNLTSIDMFTFGDSADANTAASTKCRRSTKCRVIPGNALYPISLVWDIFGLLLGPGALIKTVPLAAPCFSNWGVQDASKCSFITNNWSNDSYMQ